MIIENNILKYYLRNVYFINGTAYAGKSTAVKLLAEKYDMICCGENYHMDGAFDIADPDKQPNMTWLRDLKDFREFVMRSPEEYVRWIFESKREVEQFEIAKLISIAGDRKVIVDTNIRFETLWEISDYNHVAVMVAPQSMSVDRFFDRSDPDKQHILSVIESCPEPEKVMANYRRGLELINSREHYDECVNAGFFTLVREDDGRDTREEVVNRLAAHFGLI